MKATDAGSTPNALIRGRASAPQLVTIMASFRDCGTAQHGTACQMTRSWMQLLCMAEQGSKVLGCLEDPKRTCRIV
jgi:hypothetical protein